MCRSAQGHAVRAAAVMVPAHEQLCLCSVFLSCAHVYLRLHRPTHAMRRAVKLSAEHVTLIVGNRTHWNACSDALKMNIFCVPGAQKAGVARESHVVSLQPRVKSTRGVTEPACLPLMLQAARCNTNPCAECTNRLRRTSALNFQV